MSHTIKYAHDSVFFYLNDFSSRVVAKSGLPGDRYHLGKLIFQGLKEDQDFLFQIDGSTNESETNGSALLRSIKCANAFRNMGLKKGDVIVLMAPNHIDLAIPLYAALYLGIVVAAIDATLGIEELKGFFEIDEPKIVFCHASKYKAVDAALVNAGVKSKIITFDNNPNCTNFKDFVSSNSDEILDRKKVIDEFKLEDFDPAETLAFLTTTSGTTGLSKAIALTHKNLAIAIPYIWLCDTNFPTPTKVVLLIAPLQWLSSGFHYLFSPMLKYTRLQVSEPLSREVFAKVVNKYKPTYTAISPTLLQYLWKIEQTDCDMTCFETIWLGGSFVPEDLLEDIKKIKPGIRTAAGYGLSEVGGLVFYDQFTKKGSVGKPLGSFDYKLVDPETMEDISEPNVHGELWLRGLPVSKGYYKCPEATAETFVEGGWFKTGDIFYRDDDWNFFFVERMKLLLKYRNHQISPIELEAVIRQHPAVQDAAVTGLPDKECGELPVAFVVRKPNQTVTAQEIKDLVIKSVTDTKHLRGGVIFIDEIPMTTTTKVHRKQLREMAVMMNRE
ncbi:luciferin 4-monooxygenase [Manduca sexta]|uniref:Luciferin 4-monooxygenase n=1 Tax=Manduca sexta TaxID=7130 RepID=A0A921ZEF0_MANSE|nr:luciferin 4-monooxygenase [Manduca sexta]KAG6456346.1 hypothetical protein O3G_MSEX009689 [Manduca sexta]